MNLGHLHLLINHLPIFGTILGGIVLIYAIWQKSEQTKIAAYNLFIISAIGAVIAYVTGEPAEELVEDIQGVTKNAIEEHEEFAIFALVSLIILGGVSILSLFLTIKKSPISKTIALVTLFVSLISFGLIAKTGSLGGQIRHTELNQSSASQTQGEQEHDDD